MDPTVICPQFRYVEPNGSGGVTKVDVLTAVQDGLGVGNDQQIIAAVTGKIIEVISIVAYSNYAGVETFKLKSGSGGSAIFGTYGIQQNSNPIAIEHGSGDPLCKTAAGVGLFADIAGGNYLYLTVNYLTYAAVAA